MGKAVEVEIANKIAVFLKMIRTNNPFQEEFFQAVKEVITSVMPFALENSKYVKYKVLERMVEPDRIVIFRVSWQDDNGEVQVNRAWRVQFNNSIGPYKGGMRFHPSVNLSILKFLGFEQCFKNSLTGLPLGGAKGGSNFDPKHRSDAEVMRFCHALMIELHRHIGENTDVPAGDIGVGGREIGYMFGQYKRIVNKFTGTITGKGVDFGGSLIRKEATGYGAVYFAENVLNFRGDSLKGKTIVVSGSGNVAIYVTEKALNLGAQVLTLSDSSGYIYDREGFNEEKIAAVKEIKEIKRARIGEYVKIYPKAEFHPNKRPWEVAADIAIPSATQNELDEEDAKKLIANGVQLVCEAANMPVTLGAIELFNTAKVIFNPGKAANAGGVAVSGFEQSQNSLRMTWSAEEVEDRLKNIMKDIHDTCVKFGYNKKKSDIVNYVDGANIGGFVKIANAMTTYGVV
ncbi:NADP-specific glutamate dehydrogenase [Spirochaetota bacterium]|nr:NADP-specific glutamate dehydrogenase [Spirochaetota bacterium]